MWDLELDNKKFEEVYQQYLGYDIVTFWGVLEHTPNPRALVEAAYNVVSQSGNGGMVIAKLPRWHSLSSAIQKLCPNTVIRHADPMGDS
ncbi:2-polyprenyl-3-methyl-5-hydroxy-6-metoxy-1,4-benzoquinol methylase [Methanocalculus sp. AMF5]|uniref:class I SAM-dependent methyltransferase n=1 Tax=Methanocalculus sp. AMF5 TaxID=1198257 RepID=UPI00209CF6CC|nr:class I SAM-dependent methyltransferase [Methanocalculus sp. AMF5]MCP1663266.1 2-polyprenyl-3-methyl-5-hydroxy-6-metoxy-1,4-benzoquinol methylase [Methanocalculus sp. AMF5]